MSPAATPTPTTRILFTPMRVESHRRPRSAAQPRLAQQPNPGLETFACRTALSAPLRSKAAGGGEAPLSEPTRGEQPGWKRLRGGPGRRSAFRANPQSKAKQSKARGSRMRPPRAPGWR